MDLYVSGIQCSDSQFFNERLIFKTFAPDRLVSVLRGHITQY